MFGVFTFLTFIQYLILTSHGTDFEDATKPFQKSEVALIVEAVPSCRRWRLPAGCCDDEDDELPKVVGWHAQGWGWSECFHPKIAVISCCALYQIAIGWC